MTIMVFAKAPRPGHVKTRLRPTLGANGAARLQRQLVLNTLRVTCGVSAEKTELWCSPNTFHPFYQQCAKQFRLTLRPQQGQDLGDRMYHAFVAHANDKVNILIGCDCPEMSQAYLLQVRRYLSAGYDAVLGPARDGGYVLIAFNKIVPTCFFNMPWGSDRVCEITRERLRKAGINWVEMPAMRDLDRPEDLRILKHRLLNR